MLTNLVSWAGAGMAGILMGWGLLDIAARFGLTTGRVWLWGLLLLGGAVGGTVVGLIAGRFPIG